MLELLWWLQTLSCIPKDWLDILQPITTYLQEVSSRFPASMQHNPDAISSAQSLANSLASAMQQHLPVDGTVAKTRTTDWRRLLTSLQLLQRQLNAQQDNTKAIEQLQKMQDLQAARQKQSAAGYGAADQGRKAPGDLDPAGSQHDNDKVNHLEISVAPTRDEVLCTARPFLPSNK